MTAVHMTRRDNAHFEHVLPIAIATRACTAAKSRIYHNVLNITCGTRCNCTVALRRALQLRLAEHDMRVVATSCVTCRHDSEAGMTYGVASLQS